MVEVNIRGACQIKLKGFLTIFDFWLRACNLIHIGRLTYTYPSSKILDAYLIQIAKLQKISISDSTVNNPTSEMTLSNIYTNKKSLTRKTIKIEVNDRRRQFMIYKK